MMNIQSPIYLSVVLFVAIAFQGCTSTYSDHIESESPQVLIDRDEAKLIARYLNDGDLDYLKLKQVFYDLFLIRSLYGDDMPFLNWSEFRSPGSPQSDIAIVQKKDRCTIYPREIRDGISYLFIHVWSGYDSIPYSMVYYYFECKFDEAYYIGFYEHDNPRIPEWWIEAEKNLLLYESK